MEKYLFEKAKLLNKTIVFPEAAYSERVKAAGKYLIENNKYNCFKFRHYNLKKWIYFYLMKKLRKI